jgi:transcriptional regulator with XRE-family HTH domain
LALGDRIKHYRKSRGLSQRELAKRAGVRQKQISAYELGQNVPSATVLGEISRALDVPADSLIHEPVGITRPSLSTGSLEDKLKLLEELSERDKDLVQEILDMVILRQEVRDTRK